MKSCTLCPRGCGVNRTIRSGVCGARGSVRVARAALHFWEEPCISGENGSGTVFFSGCPLGCVYCQNAEISRGQAGKEITDERLCEIFLELEKKGANNINLVTPAHFAPRIADALKAAIRRGLGIPVVCNSGGYELPETLELLRGLVDIWLPDFKYMSSELAARYSLAPDYPKIAKAALQKMFSLGGSPEFDRRGIMQKGVVVRHLVLPSHTDDSKRIIQYLYETYGDDIYISIMNQFTPTAACAAYPEINRAVNETEYAEVVAFARSIGVVNGFTQSGGSMSESFIPPFDLTGV